MSKVRILFQPYNFIEGVKCPYCKQETLGVISVGIHDYPRFMFTCVAEACVTNHRSQIPNELQYLVKDALGYPPPHEEERQRAIAAGFVPAVYTHTKGTDDNEDITEASE